MYIFITICILYIDILDDIEETFTTATAHWFILVTLVIASFLGQFPFLNTNQPTNDFFFKIEKFLRIKLNQKFRKNTALNSDFIFLILKEAFKNIQI